MNLPMSFDPIRPLTRGAGTSADVTHPKFHSALVVTLLDDNRHDLVAPVSCLRMTALDPLQLDRQAVVDAVHHRLIHAMELVGQDPNGSILVMGQRAGGIVKSALQLRLVRDRHLSHSS